MHFTRTLWLGALAIVLAIGLFLTSALLGNHRPTPQATTPSGRGEVVSAAAVANPGDLSSAIAALQTRLRRLPNDSGSWSALGSAYVQQARVSGDPSYYSKAGRAFRRSLDEQPHGNYTALTGRSALAASRHDFGRAYQLATQSKRINRFSSVNQGMLVDALVELGRYGAAAREAHRMVNLKPGVPSYTRVSYIFELRGDRRGAVFAMHQALKIAYSRDDQAFALFQLGELAWNSGDLSDAACYYQRGLRLGTDYVPLLYGRAKVEAARGRTRGALADFQTVVDRYPSPTYLVEYVELLQSLGRDTEAAAQEELISAQEEILLAAGVNLDLELALYDADHGYPRQSLRSAERAFHDRRSVFVEDAYAWALHVNGRDHRALVHSVHAARLGTRSALFSYHRGMIERSLGHDEAAQLALTKALAINPYFSSLHVPVASRVLTALRRDR